MDTTLNISSILFMHKHDQIIDFSNKVVSSYALLMHYGPFLETPSINIKFSLIQVFYSSYTTAIFQHLTFFF